MPGCLICGSTTSARALASPVTGKHVCEECTMRFLYWIERNAELIRAALGITDQTPKASGPRCQVCGEVQIVTPNGVTCPNGHKDAHGVDVKPGLPM